MRETKKGLAESANPLIFWLRGPATTCRRTGRWASASRSRSKSVFQSRPRVHSMSQSLCGRRQLLKHTPPTFPAHCLGYPRSSMCSGGGEDHPAPARRQGHTDHRPPRVTPRDRRAREAALPNVPERGSGARRTPSCWRREVAFVLIRPVHRSIDGGGLSSLARFKLSKSNGQLQCEYCLRRQGR